jgi:hypothetical protein
MVTRPCLGPAEEKYLTPLPRIESIFFDLVARRCTDFAVAVGNSFFETVYFRMVDDELEGDQEGSGRVLIEVIRGRVSK